MFEPCPKWYWGTLSCAGQSALLNMNLAGGSGAPGIGSVAPGAYVIVMGEGVPEDMPEEIKLRRRTPLVPVGTGIGCDDPNPVIPVCTVKISSVSKGLSSKSLSGNVCCVHWQLTPS